MRVYVYCTVLSASMILLAGCGSDNGYNGAVGQVTGVVNLAGTPISEEATITLINGEGGFAVTGQVDNTGHFRLKYNGSNSIPVGKYNVGVLPHIPVPVTNQSPEAFFNEDGTTKVTETKTSKIPEKYHQPGGSGIVVEIVEGDQELPIDLD